MCTFLRAVSKKLFRIQHYPLVWLPILARSTNLLNIKKLLVSTYLQVTIFYCPLVIYTIYTPDCGYMSYK